MMYDVDRVICILEKLGFEKNPSFSSIGMKRRYNSNGWLYKYEFTIINGKDIILNISGRKAGSVENEYADGYDKKLESLGLEPLKSKKDKNSYSCFEYIQISDAGRLDRALRELQGVVYSECECEYSKVLKMPINLNDRVLRPGELLCGFDGNTYFEYMGKCKCVMGDLLLFSPYPRNYAYRKVDTYYGFSRISREIITIQGYRKKIKELEFISKKSHKIIDNT